MTVFVSIFCIILMCDTMLIGICHITIIKARESDCVSWFVLILTLNCGRQLLKSFSKWQFLCQFFCIILMCDTMLIGICHIAIFKALESDCVSWFRLILTLNCAQTTFKVIFKMTVFVSIFLYNFDVRHYVDRNLPYYHLQNTRKRLRVLVCVDFDVELW